MRIAEIYHSVQGEGRLTGTPSVFVRTSGCNLRCWFCDTPYSSWEPEGEDLSVKEIGAQMGYVPSRHVVVTGGEPMVWAELVPLTERLREEGYHVTIETAGTLFLPVVCDLMSISPKLSGSAPDAARFPRWSRRHQQTRFRPHVLRALMRDYDYQLKFVVDQPADVDEVLDVLRDFPEVDHHRVLLMPQGTNREQLASVTEWLVKACQTLDFQYCPRRHIEWYGAVRGR